MYVFTSVHVKITNKEKTLSSFLEGWRRQYFNIYRDICMYIHVHTRRQLSIHAGLYYNRLIIYIHYYKFNMHKLMILKTKGFTTAIYTRTSLKYSMFTGHSKTTFIHLTYTR